MFPTPPYANVWDASGRALGGGIGKTRCAACGVGKAGGVVCCIGSATCVAYCIDIAEEGSARCTMTAEGTACIMGSA